VHVSSSAGKRLVAYFVGESGHNISPDECASSCSRSFQNTWCRASFIPLAKLPLNANGKVNRAALPVPEINTAITDATAVPRDSTETQLRPAWERVLEVGPIGIRSNFFELGAIPCWQCNWLRRSNEPWKKAVRSQLISGPRLKKWRRCVRGREARAQAVRL